MKNIVIYNYVMYCTVSIWALLEKLMKTIALAILAVFALGSCNTMIGIGRDFRQLGSGLEHKAHGRSFDGSDKTPETEENLPTY